MRLERDAIDVQGAAARVSFSSARARALGLSAVTWLALLVVTSTVVRAAIAMTMDVPWVLPDELVYAELAKSLAEDGRLAIRDVINLEWGPIYPILIAPAWFLFDDPERAHRLVFVINACVMSLAAVPAYLLGRMFVSPRSALLVAGFALLVPSMAYTNLVMTENAFYPAFLLSVFLIARAVERPSPARQAAVLGSVVLLVLIRFQGAAVMGALLLAIGVYAALLPSHERRSYLRRFVPSALVVAVVTVMPTILSVARGEGVLGWLGQYGDAFAAFRPSEVPKWLIALAADLTLYVAVAPVAAVAILAVVGLTREADARLRLFLAVVLSTLAAMLVAITLVSAAMDVDGEENLNERYLFYVVPLTILGLALWIERGLPRPRPALWLVVGACSILPALIPINQLGYNATFQSPGLMPWILLPLSAVPLAVLVLCFTTGAALLWARVSAAGIGRVWLLVGVTFTLTAIVTAGDMRQASEWSSRPGEARNTRWIDDAVPGSVSVPVLWDERGFDPDLPERGYHTVMLAEFLNRSVGTVYRLGPETHYDSWLLTRPLELGADGIVRTRGGRALTPSFVLAPSRVRVVGTPLRRDPVGDLVLYRLEGALRLHASTPR